VDHDLLRVVTIGENIKEISRGNEIESRESSSLAVHEVVKGLFTKGELLLYFFKSVDDAFLSTENESLLLSLTILKDSLDFLVNVYEFLTHFGEFFLDFF
jgi:hypothetical protein